jgi:hypothetical protein
VRRQYGAATVRQHLTKLSMMTALLQAALLLLLLLMLSDDAERHYLPDV